MKLAFPSDNGFEYIPSERTFLLFIDETGGESLSDPNFPVFGFGGIGVPSSLYISNLCTPWVSLKAKGFGGEQISLHASDLKEPTSKQLDLLNSFFTGCVFCRIAAIISDKTVFENKHDVYNIAVRVFYSRILDVLQYTEYDDIFMIFENSQRGNPLNKDYFSRYKFQKEDENGKMVDVNCKKFIMAKSEMEPGLEVADFVAQTAGSSVRSRLFGKRTQFKERKDYTAVFKSGDKRLSSFFEVTKVVNQV